MSQSYPSTLAGRCAICQKNIFWSEHEWFQDSAGLPRHHACVSQGVDSISYSGNLIMIKRGQGSSNPKLTTQKPIYAYLSAGDASAETIRLLLDALSELHVAAGGKGFVFTVEGQLGELTVVRCDEVNR